MSIVDWKLRELQPSQFYISEKKLREVEAWFDAKDLSSFAPIPVKLLDGRPVMTDGHTRAVAALRAGLDAVPLVWDADALDWEMYRVCVEACRSRQVCSPCDLLERVLSAEDYRAQWDGWCDAIQEAVIRNRVGAVSGHRPEALGSLEYQPLSPAHDAALAALIRDNLRAHQLDIPGTAYYDEALDRLSAFYQRPGRAYYVLLQDGAVVGGIGVAELRGDCCELQKLYLADSVKGHGLGYEMIRLIEAQARAFGYRQIYLETHTNLAAAIHVYERSGFQAIPRPEGVVHSTMNRFYLKSLE